MNRQNSRLISSLNIGKSPTGAFTTKGYGLSEITSRFGCLKIDFPLSSKNIFQIRRGKCKLMYNSASTKHAIKHYENNEKRNPVNYGQRNKRKKPN